MSIIYLIWTAIYSQLDVSNNRVIPLTQEMEK